MPLDFNKAVSSDLLDLQAQKSTTDESIRFPLPRCQNRQGRSNWKTRQQWLC